MTEAYVTGFYKTAEEYGVDPTQLMKVAEELEKEALSWGNASKALGLIPKAFKGLRQGLGNTVVGAGRSIGGLPGQGFRSAAKQFAGDIGQTKNVITGVGKALGQDVAANSRYLRDMAAFRLARTGRNIGQGVNRAINRVGNDARQVGRYMSNGYNTANRFMRRNPLATILGGGALGYGIAKMTGNNANNNVNNNTGVPSDTDFGAVD